MAVMMFLFAVLALLGTVNAHSYHLGSCPSVEPMPNFDINRFLGRWYVIQKTSTGSTCLTNNYTVDPNATGHYLLQQYSQNLIGDLISDVIFRYTGNLTIPDSKKPAAMEVTFPFNVIGSANYTVFSTDYDRYAGVFTCQKLITGHRQSASILSRTPTLDKQYVDKVRTKLTGFGVDPYDLSIIKHDDCTDSSKAEVIDVGA